MGLKTKCSSIGCFVYATDRNIAALQKTFENQLGNNHELLALDVTSADQIQAAGTILIIVIHHPKKITSVVTGIRFSVFL